MNRVGRVAKILATVLRYRLDGNLSRFVGERWWIRLSPLRLLPNPKKPDAVRLREALEHLGPIFIKFGQILSTRRDLLPRDYADELAKLQDRVPPFDSGVAVRLIEEALGGSIDEKFATFEREPLASASLAQVHAATTDDGDHVVVKVIRPDIEQTIAKDIRLIFTMATLLEALSKEARRLRLKAVVADYERTIFDELNLLKEAANTATLRRNFAGSKLLYAPKVYWELCTETVLVLERVYAPAISDMDALERAGTDLRKLAERGVETFFTQLFKHNFFHADMHPGNIFVDITDPRDPSYIAIDCAIVGSLTDADQSYLARNVVAFLNRDYARIARLHIESGWNPAHHGCRRVRVGHPPTRRAALPAAPEGHLLRPLPRHPVPDCPAVQHGGAAATGAAAKDAAEHRRLGPSALPGPRPVAHRQAVHGTLDARALRPGGRRAQPHRQRPGTGHRTAATLAAIARLDHDRSIETR